MKTYKKEFIRENTLFSIQVWEEHQGHRLGKYFGQNIPPTIFDAFGGVVHVYYLKDILKAWRQIISESINSNPKVVGQLMNLYETQIGELEKFWKRGALDSREELIHFFDFMSEAWVGGAVSYWLPDTPNIDKKYQDLGMELRKRSADFLDSTDKVIYRTLEKLYPDLKDLIKYLSIEELRAPALFSEEILKERKKHYIYFNFEILTHVDLSAVAEKNGIQISKEDMPESLTELEGQVAMSGAVSGRVRVLHSKSEINNLADGEILVTAMTTPDFVPAMKKAAAIVTDEGGITCHAAIVSRELGKPCIIGTKFATQILKDGDFVEVDANTGMVKILERGRVKS